MKRKWLSVISCFMIILLMPQTVFALSALEKSDEQLIAENIVVLESVLAENYTDVVNELNKMIEQYEEILADTATEEESEQINNLIATSMPEYRLHRSFNCRSGVLFTGLFCVSLSGASPFWV